MATGFPSEKQMATPHLFSPNRARDLPVRSSFSYLADVCADVVQKVNPRGRHPVCKHAKYSSLLKGYPLQALYSFPVALFISSEGGFFFASLEFVSGMIPEADYTEENGALFGGRKGNKKGHPPSNGVQFGEDGLVVPKKPSNPCLESTERQSLHRELLFNQKIGKNVIGQKTELQKAMEKFRDDQKKKELEEEKVQNKTAFEKRLEEQANKLKLQEETEAKKSESAPLDQPEFLRVHARVCAQTVDQTT